MERAALSNALEGIQPTPPPWRGGPMRRLGARQPSAWRTGTRRLAILASIVIGALGVVEPSRAMTFFDSLTGTTLNPNLSITTSPGFHITLPGGGALLTKDAVVDRGAADLNSIFTFSGNYMLTVHAFGLQSGLTNVAEAGLAIFGAGTFSDVFAYNNSLGFANNGLGASVLSHTPVGPGEELLTIAGSTALPLQMGVFLLQEYGGTAFNTVSFTNLRLDADRFSGVVDVPEPATLTLFTVGLLGIGLLRRRSNPHRAA
jgi:hypothetical protein